MSDTQKYKQQQQEKTQRSEKRQKRLKDIVRSQYSSCASDAKWRKIFTDLASQITEDTISSIKFIWSEKIHHYDDLTRVLVESDHFISIHGEHSYDEIESITVYSPIQLNLVYHVDIEYGDDCFTIFGYRNI